MVVIKYEMTRDRYSHISNRLCERLWVVVTKSLTTKCIASLNIRMIWFIPLSNKKNHGNPHDMSQKRGNQTVSHLRHRVYCTLGNKHHYVVYDQWTLDRVLSVWNINHSCFCRWGDERRVDNTARQRKHHSQLTYNRLWNTRKLNCQAVAAIGVFYLIKCHFDKCCYTISDM